MLFKMNQIRSLSHKPKTRWRCHNTSNHPPNMNWRFKKLRRSNWALLLFLQIMFTTCVQCVAACSATMTRVTSTSPCENTTRTTIIAYSKMKVYQNAWLMIRMFRGGTRDSLAKRYAQPLAMASVRCRGDWIEWKYKDRVAWITL